MDEREDFGFEDFESALFDDDYQTGDENDSDDSHAAETNTNQDTASSGEEDPQDGDSSEDEHTSESAEQSANGDGEADVDTPADQSFTIKVNKEERKVTLSEMIALAQKGDDYDRVKEQAAKHQQTISELQSQLDGFASQKGVLDILETIAQKSGSTMEDLAETLYVNFRKSAGASEDAAREELRSAKLEQELNSIKAQHTQKQEQENDSEARAKRDLEEFSLNYPDVKLTEDLVDKLVPDIQNGMTLSAAYRKYEKAQDSARIAELERQLAAKSQNEKNQRRSPGSQQDSGGRSAKSDYEEFERALFG